MPNEVTTPKISNLTVLQPFVIDHTCAEESYQSQGNQFLLPTGTIPWMAPEFLEDRNIVYSAKTEVYSFAVLLWEIFCGKAVNNRSFSNKCVLAEPYPHLQPV